MSVGKGLTRQSTSGATLDFSGGWSDRAEYLRQMRQASAGSPRGRAPMDVVMISSSKGKTDDTVTGVPPAFNTDARDRWAKRREEAEIERLFR